jgi:hypothetical protein
VFHGIKNEFPPFVAGIGRKVNPFHQKSKEQRAKSREQGAGSKEQGASAFA